MKNVIERLGFVATEHFLDRARSRGLPGASLELILLHGSVVHGRGAAWMTLRRKDVPAELRLDRWAQRANGWIIATGLDETTLVTCFHRDFDAVRFLQRRVVEIPDLKKAA